MIEYFLFDEVITNSYYSIFLSSTLLNFIFQRPEQGHAKYTKNIHISRFSLNFIELFKRMQLSTIFFFNITFWQKFRAFLILFCLSGIPHILEHCTLCGSNQFPVRDPFMKMLNRSLATMNAMTGPDYTLYPFATPNKKDFYNLMQVRKSLE